MTPSLERPDRPPGAVRAAVVNDYDVVLAGVRALLAPFEERIEIVELVANEDVRACVDVALYDAFAQPDPDFARLRGLVADPRAGRVVLYSWNLDQQLIERALDAGAAGCLAKTLPGDELADALIRVAEGEELVRPRVGRALAVPELEWPGKLHGLSEREAEILALIVQGFSNIEIAALVHLSINTIKGHIRSCYRKIGATNRVDAVLWGTEHGMRPDHDRIEGWTTAS